MQISTWSRIVKADYGCVNLNYLSWYLNLNKGQFLSQFQIAIPGQVIRRSLLPDDMALLCRWSCITLYQYYFYHNTNLDVHHWTLIFYLLFEIYVLRYQSTSCNQLELLMKSFLRAQLHCTRVQAFKIKGHILLIASEVAKTLGTD